VCPWPPLSLIDSCYLTGCITSVDVLTLCVCEAICLFPMREPDCEIYIVCYHVPCIIFPLRCGTSLLDPSSLLTLVSWWIPPLLFSPRGLRLLRSSLDRVCSRCFYSCVFPPVFLMVLESFVLFPKRALTERPRCALFRFFTPIVLSGRPVCFGSE